MHISSGLSERRNSSKQNNEKNQEQRQAERIWQEKRRGYVDMKIFRRGTRYAASYTVEMAYIMAVFCLVMVVLIQQAYRLHDETKSGMTLQETVELIRHDEDDRRDEIVEGVRSRSGLLFSMNDWNMELEKSRSRVTGQLSGSRPEGTWNLEISSKVYEPEEFLRKVAALKQLEERYEGQVQEGNAP